MSDLLPGARGRLLAVLVQIERPVSVRALAREAGVSPQSALDTVNNLVDAGLLHAEPAGSARMVALNHDHLLAGPLTELVATRRRLVERLTDELTDWPQLAGAWLFGSTARGDGDRSSDIDLLLISSSEDLERRDWIAATSRLRELVERWTGNRAEVVEHTPRSFAALGERSAPLLQSLQDDGIALTPTSRVTLRGAA